MPETSARLGGRVDLITEAAREALDVRKLVGEPIVHGATMVIPVARVAGGSGMGYGAGTVDAPGHRPSSAAGGQGDGGGGGFGVTGRALGAYVIRDDSVEWRPAIDLTRVVLGAQAAAVVAVVTLARALRRRRPRH